jgi:sugar phosphate isomerase/epimerase
LPFIDTLKIIKSAGFDFIELAGHWKGGDWEIAQHLKGIPIIDVLNMVKDSGLQISTLHDMGGLLDNDSDSIISKDTYEYMESAKRDIPCVVFHTPHKKTSDPNWWTKYKSKAISDLNSFKGNHIICIENLPLFENYIIPLTDPEEMIAFVKEADIHVNNDTTHYAQCNIELNNAALHLKDRVRTIHISDYHDGKAHVFVGDGELNFMEFAQRLDLKLLHAVTIECGVPSGNNEYSYYIEKYREAKVRTEELFSH